MPVAKCLFVFVGALFCETLIAQESHSLASAGKSVMTYNALFVESPDADQPWYGRSGFIHPMYTPSGRVVTDGFPTDHLHQHGLMFAWTSAVVNGRKVDFWNSKKQVGVVEHVETTHADSEKIVVHTDRSQETSDNSLNFHRTVILLIKKIASMPTTENGLDLCRSIVMSIQVMFRPPATDVRLNFNQGPHSINGPPLC